MQACDRCHTRKTRCDRRIPQCSACEKAGVPCLHADKLRHRNVPRGYIDNIECMVQRLKEDNRILRRKLASCRSSGTEVRDAVTTPTTPSTANAENSDSRHPAVSHHLQGCSDGGNQNESRLCAINSPGDLFVEEVGYISSATTSELSYPGSSNNLCLSMLLATLVDDRDPISAGLLEEWSHDCRRAPPSSELPVDTSLPSRADAMTLIENYFLHTHVVFPLLHRSSFMAMVNRIYTEPDYYHSAEVEAFTFDIVLAIGAFNLNRHQDPTTGFSIYYAKAKSKFRSVIATGRYTALKAILLVCQHDLLGSLNCVTTSLWYLIGIAARICIELNLHTDERRVETSSLVSVITMEEEMKRRCFWSLYTIDRYVVRQCYETGIATHPFV